MTSVGGTKNFNPEVAVSRFASGGGFSNYFPRPAYQASTVDAYVASLNGLHDGLYNKSGRAYPDVAAQGNFDVVVWAQSIIRVGGTSASSPTFASVIALVNDALLAKGKPTLGFINPWLYSKAYKTLTDVTVGSSFGCNTTGFPAQAGWDAVTGFGTPVSQVSERYGGKANAIADSLCRTSASLSRPLSRRMAVLGAVTGVVMSGRGSVECDFDH